MVKPHPDSQRYPYFAYQLKPPYNSWPVRQLWSDTDSESDASSSIPSSYASELDDDEEDEDDDTVDEYKSHKIEDDESRGSENWISSNPYGKIRYFEESDEESLLSRAANSLTGVEFLELDLVQEIIGGLTGISLLDMTWSVLEQWQDKDVIWRLRPNLRIVLACVNQALELDSPHSIIRLQ